jgi:hypothetical protein
MARPRQSALILLLVAIGPLSACSNDRVTAAQLAAEANKRISLPSDLGDGYRLDSITAEGNAVVSTVTVTDASLASDPRFVEVMRTATTSDICREIAPARQAYTNAGLTVAKVYKNASGAQIVRVDVTPADCG